MAQKANPPAKTSRVTTAFVKNASVGSKFAVDSSRLAAQKAQNPDVKNFAQKLADDYGEKSDELKQMAEQAGLRVTETFSGAPRRTLPNARFLPRSMLLIVQKRRNDIY